VTEQEEATMTSKLSTDDRLTRLEDAFLELEGHVGATGGDQSRANRPNLAAIVAERRSAK
jgi:hypothetical protein